MRIYLDTVRDRVYIRQRGKVQMKGKRRRHDGAQSSVTGRVTYVYMYVVCLFTRVFLLSLTNGEGYNHITDFMRTSLPSTLKCEVQVGYDANGLIITGVNR